LLRVLTGRRGKPPQTKPPEAKRFGAAEHGHAGVRTPVGHEQSPVLLLRFVPRHGSIVGTVARKIAVDLWENDQVRGQRDGICAGGLVGAAHRKGRRTVRLTPQAAVALEGPLERQLTQIEALGDFYCDQGLVFTTERGTPINPSNLRQRSFVPLLKRAGLPHIRFHDLRHTCATLLLGKGVHPKFVQELLGHATIAITLDTYSHVLPGMGDHTAVAMEDALF